MSSLNQLYSEVNVEAKKKNRRVGIKNKNVDLASSECYDSHIIQISINNNQQYDFSTSSLEVTLI